MKAYDLHRAWQKTFDRLHPGGYIRKSETEISLAAFKAGMLAAADIAETHDAATIAESIRVAANG